MKKFFSVVLVSAMVVLTAFTGCSENDTSNGSSQTTSKSSDVQSSAVADKADFDSEEVEKNIKITPYIYDDVSTHYFVAEYVQYTALFFQGDELVYADNYYVVDSDNEIKAGQTEKAESLCNKKFDSVKVYLNGSAY